MKTMRALASNGFHSGSSSSKQCISSRLVHFKGTMRDDITSAVNCSNIMAHGVYEVVSSQSPWVRYWSIKLFVAGSLLVSVF